jgi:hypothetical protein
MKMCTLVGRVGSVFSDQLSLVNRNIAGESLALFSTLEVVVRPVGSLTDDAQFTRFHALDLGDFVGAVESQFDS